MAHAFGTEVQKIMHESQLFDHEHKNKKTHPIINHHFHGS